MLEKLKQSNSEQVMPEGFMFNPDILAEHDEQMLMFLQDAAHQAAPTPSFENVPTIDIEPMFNPTGVPTEEIYVRTKDSEAPFRQFTEMWRIVDRDRLKDGTALVCSQVLKTNSVGEVEASKSKMNNHLGSNHNSRMNDLEATTPYVSFSTDPSYLASRMILGYGFGVKDGRDSVVVRVCVDSSRIHMSTRRKQPEVLLLGGVAPDEYMAAYEVNDFVNTLVADDAHIRLPGDQVVSRAEAMSHWVAS
ncbi:MAG: hypothetical protein ACR2FM_02405 [Candidatus Saccharimonadales bacterium]